MVLIVCGKKASVLRIVLFPLTKAGGAGGTHIIQVNVIILPRCNGIKEVVVAMVICGRRSTEIGDSCGDDKFPETLNRN